MMRSTWRQLWLRVSAWTPIVLLAAAAAFSWWVAQAVMRAEQPHRLGAARSDLPDYVLRDFSAATYDAQGRLTAVLRGAQMQHLPADDTFAITAPQLRVVSPLGVVTTARARRALSNADGSNVQLLGDAVVERRAAAGKPPLVVRSDFLNLFPNQQIVQSNRRTVVQQGQTRFTANTLDADGVSGTVAMQGMVSAVIATPRDSTPTPR